MSKQKVDWPSFVASVAIILVASISLVLFPESGTRFLVGKEDSSAARLIDWLFMIGLLGGVGTSLGFSTPMIAAAVGRIAGWEADFGVVVVDCLWPVRRVICHPDFSWTNHQTGHIRYAGLWFSG
jgi:choline-glycine betaine transporter